ncbi:hypothetical protein N7516_004268 [Penicillium verrucosum]|uniref:uncharacterized protein n=1 Tax=Penicillium verrucosum TaxID=60171 RepID=UPI002545A178|nr:uncharacterized protein N7516_004268 [Penicillium verrucosum]KAJ5944100.1 hypothetical protein N7516_004268 [Penicillium verrucosum]
MARNMTDRDPFRHLEYVQGESGAYNPHKADAMREEVARRAEENDGEWWSGTTCHLMGDVVQQGNGIIMEERYFLDTGYASRNSPPPEGGSRLP